MKTDQARERELAHKMNLPPSRYQRTSILLRKPIGAIVLGLLLGGIPFGALKYLDLGYVPSVKLILYGALVATTAALSGENPVPKRLLQRACLAAFATCIVPVAIFVLAAWIRGYEMLDPRNLPVNALGYAFFAMVIAILGWLFALLCKRLGLMPQA